MNSIVGARQRRPGWLVGLVTAVVLIAGPAYAADDDTICVVVNGHRVCIHH